MSSPTPSLHRRHPRRPRLRRRRPPPARRARLGRASRAATLLVAEADGALVAAHSPDTGATIADPFRRTAAGRRAARSCEARMLRAA